MSEDYRRGVVDGMKRLNAQRHKAMQRVYAHYMALPPEHRNSRINGDMIDLLRSPATFKPIVPVEEFADA